MDLELQRSHPQPMMVQELCPRAVPTAGGAAGPQTQACRGDPARKPPHSTPGAWPPRLAGRRKSRRSLAASPQSSAHMARSKNKLLFTTNKTSSSLSLNLKD